MRVFCFGGGCFFLRPLSSSDAKAMEFRGHDIFSADAGDAHGHGHMSDTKAAHLQGHDVFADVPERAFVPSKVQLDTKMQRDLHANNVFSDAAEPHRPGKAQLETKMQRDMHANNVFSDAAEPHRPGTAQSRAKAAEMSGQNIFSDGEGFVASEVSEARAAHQAAMGGHDVFSNETGETRRAVGGVSKPPGGGSNIVF